ncbi:hypothetical protein CDD80_3299 [Ophiocordyceps camponoti-rufipedis]|uniref:Opine dehydrogenase domain-containing protein n=1 Tax=Ophiocordyceps camponoti-rufipedis TaxID=2004952 RepID=A0A2C5XIZ1_9HYPO|nr:hypothetical protein CDD80_3299 [Ophiocordyceps camponoti-rufipedis]
MPNHPGAAPKIRSKEKQLECSGALSGRVPVRTEEDFRPDSSLEETILIVTVPSQGHDGALNALKDWDLNSCRLVFISGNGVTVKARRLLGAKAVLETSSSPHSSRVDSEGAVTMRGIKKRLQEAERNDNVGAIFGLPVEWSVSALDIVLSALNGVVMSRQRCSTWAGSRRPTATFTSTEQTMRDFALNTDVHNRSKGAQKRFLSQDVPYWLVLCSDLGVRASVPTPVIDMLILLASTFSGVDLLDGRWRFWVWVAPLSTTLFARFGDAETETA